MIPGQLTQLTDPLVNFASVHGLTPVTVHMSFSLPRGNFARRVRGGPLFLSRGGVFSFLGLADNLFLKNNAFQTIFFIRFCNENNFLRPF